MLYVSPHTGRDRECKKGPYVLLEMYFSIFDRFSGIFSCFYLMTNRLEPTVEQDRRGSRAQFFLLLLLLLRSNFVRNNNIIPLNKIESRDTTIGTAGARRTVPRLHRAAHVHVPIDSDCWQKTVGERPGFEEEKKKSDGMNEIFFSLV